MMIASSCKYFNFPNSIVFAYFIFQMEDETIPHSFTVNRRTKNTVRSFFNTCSFAVSFFFFKYCYLLYVSYGDGSGGH
jgi:hypothetical protein